MSNDENKQDFYKSKYSFATFANFFKKQTIKTLNEIDNEAIIDFFTVYNIKDVTILNKCDSHN